MTMDIDQAAATIRELESAVNQARINYAMIKIEYDSLEIKLNAMRSSRDRWRSCAMALADEVYKRSPHLPDLDAFYQLLHDPVDGVS